MCTETGGGKVGKGSVPGGLHWARVWGVKRGRIAKVPRAPDLQNQHTTHPCPEKSDEQQLSELGMLTLEKSRLREDLLIPQNEIVTGLGCIFSQEQVIG